MQLKQQSSLSGALLIIEGLLNFCTNYIGSITVNWSSKTRRDHISSAFSGNGQFAVTQQWIICKSFTFHAILVFPCSQCCSLVLFVFPVSSEIVLQISVHRYIVCAHLRFTFSLITFPLVTSLWLLKARIRTFHMTRSVHIPAQQGLVQFMK